MMNQQDLENKLRNSAPQMGEVNSQKLFQKVLNLYSKQFQNETTSKENLKEKSKRFSFFTNLSILKKYFLVATATGILVLVFAFTNFAFLSLENGTQAITLETLIAKAQAAAEKKAATGRYYYQKTVSIGPELDAKYRNNDILEMWKDSQTGDYITISKDLQETSIHYGKITGAKISQGNRTFDYRGSGQELYEDPFNEKDGFFDFMELSKTLGSTLEAIVENKADSTKLQPFIKKLFPSYLSPANQYTAEIEYEGQMEEDGKKFEVLSLKLNYIPKKNDGQKESKHNTHFYFNANTFELEMIRFSFTHNIIKILESGYTNITPTVTLDPIDPMTFSLGDNAQPEQKKGEKFYEDAKIKFPYPTNYFLSKEFSPTADALNNTQQARVQNPKRVKTFTIAPGNRFSTSRDTVFIFITPDQPSASSLIQESQQTIQFPFGLQDNCSRLGFIFPSKTDIETAQKEGEITKSISRGETFLNNLDENLQKSEVPRVSESDYQQKLKQFKIYRISVEKICGEKINITIKNLGSKTINNREVHLFSIKSDKPQFYGYGYYFIENGMYYQVISNSAMNDAIEQIIEGFTVK